MGLSNLPTPTEGIVTTLIVSTAQSISTAKEILRSVLHVVRFRHNQPETGGGDLTGGATTGSPQLDLFPPFDEDYRCRIPSMLFKSISGGCSPDLECSVCLSRFVAEAEINRVNCGHVFHRVCLEKWFEYWHTTCPLCRSCLTD